MATRGQIHCRQTIPEPVVPIGYHGPAHVQPARPDWRDVGRAFEFPRYADAGVPATGLPDNLVATVRPDAGEDANADSKLMRYLGSRIAGKSVPSGFGAGSSAPPLVPLGNSDARRATSDDRFGGAAASTPTVLPRGMARPETPQQAAPLLGLVSGKPMPKYAVPPPIFGLPEPGVPEDGDWLLQLLARRGRR